MLEKGGDKLREVAQLVKGNPSEMSEEKLSEISEDPDQQRAGPQATGSRYESH
jgi:hypothetical protein